MESVFHEQQEGQLCAQHCINSLLQGPYYTAIDLAEIARELDQQERLRMAESGTNNSDYRHFMQEPSNNMDDSGFFSIQVITKALHAWNLELLPLASSNETAIHARNNPRNQKAFICNFRQHWFCIRKIGVQWFNLNSLLNNPEVISYTFLDIFLAQLQHEGYTIHVVIGTLPHCRADDCLNKMHHHLQQNQTSGLVEELPSYGSILDDEPLDNDLESAIALSLADLDTSSKYENDAKYNEDDDEGLQHAIHVSLESGKHQKEVKSSSVEKNALMSLSHKVKTSKTKNPAVIQSENEEHSYRTGEIMAQSRSDATAEPDIEDVRRLRLAYLDKKTQK